MIKPEAVIFDMDGVLIDSEPMHYEIEKELFVKLGISVTEEVHRLYLGTAGDFMYGDLKSRFDLPETLDELLAFDDIFRCNYFSELKEIKLNAGVIELLRELKSLGLKLAVGTSSSPDIVKILLSRSGIFQYFDAIVTTSDAGKSKPDPGVYLLAAEKIGVVPRECLVFEDSPNGIAAAKRAGMYCVAVETEVVEKDELLSADFTIPSFNGINATRVFEIYGFKNSGTKTVRLEV